MKPILSIIAVMLLTTSVHAGETQAPFGLIWGETKSQLENKGVTFLKCRDQDGFDFCLTKNPLKPVSFGEAYSLTFDTDNGLQKVAVVGNTIEEDITGSSGKSLYEKIKRSLTKKYGPPETYEYFGRYLYDEHDEFYQCLSYPGCGSWTSIWVPDSGGAVLLELHGKSRGNGYVALIYESKNFYKIIDELKEKERADDENAL